MNCVLQKSGTIILVISFVYINTWSSDQYIYNSNLMGCKSDTTQNDEMEAIVLYLADSLKLSDMGNGFKESPEIWGRYNFERFPCVNMYVIWGGIPHRHSYEDPYERILYNICDSTIYHFGGDVVSFSSVFRKAIDLNHESSYYYELILLYLNTISVKDSYYLIITENDFRAIFEKAFESASRETDVPIEDLKKRWDYNNGISIVNDIIKPAEMLKYENRINVKVFTWERKRGEIEYWSIDIFNGDIEIAERKIKLNGVGPVRILK